MRVEWSQTAEDDLDYIVNYIAADSVQNALIVDDRIREHIRILADFPEAGRSGRYPKTRELILPRDRSVAIYRVEEERVLVLRILHGGQLWPMEI